MRWAALLLGAAAACAPGPPDPPPPEIVTGTVELGLMKDAFVPIAEGADLELTPGAQGGFHVSIVVRLEGFDPTAEVEVERDTRRDDTRDLVARTTFRSPIGADGRLEHEVPVFLCPAPVDISIADEPLEVSVKVRSDVVGEASVAFVPHCPVGEEADFCDRICRR